MDKIIVILGPTATGKTDLGISLAKKFNGELIACDSRQVYKRLDIGTGKYPASYQYFMKSEGFWEIDKVKVWMYDVVDTNVQYTVAAYVQDVTKVIGGILKRNRLPIIVGGTGLYLKALLEGLPNLAVPISSKLRGELNVLTKHQLQKTLQELSPERWAEMKRSDQENPRRLLRSIELIIMNPYKKTKSNGRVLKHEFDILKIGLVASRAILYQKADLRVLSRLKQGMIKEAEELYKKGLSFERMRQLGLEYGVLANYLQGDIKTQDELIKVIQNKIHGYIRRQITWFKKEKDVCWFDITTSDYLEKIEKLVKGWYHQTK